MYFPLDISENLIYWIYEKDPSKVDVHSRFLAIPFDSNSVHTPHPLYIPATPNKFEKYFTRKGLGKGHNGNNLNLSAGK